MKLLLGVSAFKSELSFKEGDITSGQWCTRGRKELLAFFRVPNNPQLLD